MIIPENNPDSAQETASLCLQQGLGSSTDSRALAKLAEVVDQFKLSVLQSTVAACHALLDSEYIDLAVLGQFKSGKSSLLNSVLGESLLPVGALPVTAVVTRLVSGPERAVHVRYTDGKSERIAPRG